MYITYMAPMGVPPLYKNIYMSVSTSNILSKSSYPYTSWPRIRNPKVCNQLSLILPISLTQLLNVLLFLSFHITQKIVKEISVTIFDLILIPPQAQISFFTKFLITQLIPKLYTICQRLNVTGHQRRRWLQDSATSKQR